MFDWTSFNIVQAKSFECNILEENCMEMPVDLILEESSFEILEGEVVKLQNFEVSLEEPRIFIRFKLFPGNCTKNPSEWLEDHSRDVEGEEIDDFVDGCRSSNVVASHEIKHLDKLVRVKIIIVEVLIKFINDFKVIFFEEL